jgi:PAS domain S-box-containing protein
VLIVAQIMAFSKKYYQLIFIILGAGLFFLLAETAVEAFILGHGQFWSLLLSPLNIWSQVLVWLAFLIMGTIVGRNIVDYRHQIDTLHLAERKFRGLIDKSHDGIMLVDEQGRLIEWNPAMEQFTGLPRDSVLGQLAWDVQFEALTGGKSPERYQHLRQTVLDFLQTGQAPWLNKIQTVNLQNPEGEMRAGQQLAFAIQTETGTMMGTILRDITRQVMVEQALRDSEERYRMLFERMLDGYALHEIICDDAGRPIDYRFLNINPAFETLTGLTRNIIGKTVQEVLPNIEQYWIDAYGQVALTGVPARFENYSQGAGGRWFEVVAFSPAKNKFATIFRDVTDRRRSDYQLFRYQRQY